MKISVASMRTLCFHAVAPRAKKPGSVPLPPSARSLHLFRRLPITEQLSVPVVFAGVRARASLSLPGHLLYVGRCDFASHIPRAFGLGSLFENRWPYCERPGFGQFLSCFSLNRNTIALKVPPKLPQTGSTPAAGALLGQAPGQVCPCPVAAVGNRFL